jgi:hypothetical protein
MATLASKLSRVIVTKPLAIKQVLPLNSFGGATQISNQQQLRMVGTGCCYDRAEQQRTRNKLLSVTPFLLSANKRQQVGKVCSARKVYNGP